MKERRAVVTTTGSPTHKDRKTDRQTDRHTRSSTGIPFLLSSEILIDSPAPDLLPVIPGEPPVCQPVGRPLECRGSPLTPLHQPSLRPGPPPGFLSVLQRTPCAHHTGPSESTVHLETPEPQDAGRSSRGSSTPGHSSSTPLASPPIFPGGPGGSVLTATQGGSTEALT